jgi:hypothetical protein
MNPMISTAAQNDAELVSATPLGDREGVGS